MENQTNDNLLFEAQTKLTFERYQTLNLTVNKKTFRRNLIFEIIVSVVFAAVNLWLFAVSGDLLYLFLAFFFLSRVFCCISRYSKGSSETQVQKGLAVHAR